jgi:hypothetical protein
LNCQTTRSPRINATEDFDRCQPKESLPAVASEVPAAVDNKMIEVTKTEDIGPFLQING